MDFFTVPFNGGNEQAMFKNVSIAVITCTLNSSETLLRNIQSVNEQIYANFRHIFIDGASDDNSLKIVRDHARNPLILSEKDEGVFHAFNRGLEAAGDFDVFGFLHSDDHFADRFSLQRIADAFEREPAIGYFCSRVIYFSANYGEVLDIIGTSPRPMTFRQYLRRSNNFAHPSYFCRTSLIQHVGDFDTHYKSAADIDWIIRLENHCQACVFDPHPIVKMRCGGNSTAHPVRAFYEEYLIFKKYKRRPFNLFFFLYHALRARVKIFLTGIGLGYFVRLGRRVLRKIFRD